MRHQQTVSGLLIANEGRLARFRTWPLEPATGSDSVSDHQCTDTGRVQQQVQQPHCPQLTAIAQQGRCDLPG